MIPRYPRSGVAALPLRRLLVAALTVATASAAACGPARPAPTTLTVFAAASLTDALGALADAFHRGEPSITVRASYGASSTLVAQILEGAPADVFASADEANMRRLADAGRVDGAPLTFATNRLAIAVQAGNPKAVHGLVDLGRTGLVVVLAAPAVPVGRYGTEALAKAGVHVTPRSLETDVRQVLAKVALGEADAGIVYTTDVKAAGSAVEGVAIPDRENVVARYPIAVVKGSPHADVAARFVAFVHSEVGQRILARFGFQPPP